MQLFLDEIFGLWNARKLVFFLVCQSFKSRLSPFWNKPVLLFVCISTFMFLSRLSRELMSSPSLQACRQEMTFWLSIFPGRMVSPDKLPRKYWVNRGLVTSPPTHTLYTHTRKTFTNAFQGFYAMLSEDYGDTIGAMFASNCMQHMLVPYTQDHVANSDLAHSYYPSWRLNYIIGLMVHVFRLQFKTKTTVCRYKSASVLCRPVQTKQR